MKKLSRSAEDYLECIYTLGKGKKEVKSVDIASCLSVSKPAVNVAINDLIEKGFVTREKPYASVELTAEGIKIAKGVSEKHDVIKNFLLLIGVSEENAEIDCCKIEHDISKETYVKLKEFVAKAKK